MKNRTKKLLSVVSILLVMTFVLTGCSLDRLLGIRNAIHFDDMPYNFTDAETENLRQLLIDSTKRVKDTQFFWTVMKIENELGTALNDYYTKYSVLQIHTYLDNTNDELRQMQEKVSDNLVEFSNLLNTYNRTIIEGKFSDDYKDWVGEYSYQKMKDQLKLSSDEAVKLEQQRERLAIQYNKDLPQLSITHNGEKYTANDLYTANLTMEDKITLYNQIYEQNAAHFTDLYLQMINLDNERAEALGFDSTAEMYYKSFGRDYTPDDSRKFFKYVKEHIVPLANKYGSFYGVPDMIEQKRSATIRAFVEILPDLNKDMADCYNFIEEYGLADIKPSENKTEGIAFTSDLTTYDSAFLFMNWDNTFRSTQTWTHEFGHTFESYMSFYNSNYSSNLDMSEIFSQGLELLMQEHYGEFVKNLEIIEILKLSQMVDVLTNSIVYQAMLEDFQLTVYETKNLTAEGIARLYNDISIEYGLAEESTRGDCDYSWYRVTHLYDSPFYTISYCTSATVSLHLWAASQSDWDAAFDSYLKLLESDRNKDFIDILDDNDIPSPFSEKTIENIVDNIEALPFDIFLDDVA